MSCASLSGPVLPGCPTCHVRVCCTADSKLLLVVRHGQAISNYLGDTLGPDEWYVVEGTCQYDDQKGTIWNIFDAGGQLATAQHRT